MSDETIIPKTKTGGYFSAWTAAAIVLAVIIIAGGAYIWSKQSRAPGLEISLVPEKAAGGQIYVGGNVSNPGIYPLRDGDSVADILRAAGGSSGNASAGQLALVVGGKGEDAQKVDINRAEAWLLAALPGIGEGRAQSIIDYRQRHGAFRDINELLKVPGIGNTVFDGIKRLITVRE